ncbi:MAG: RHS repeat-associated core domain-containing protein, partial [Ramlibacter sp.]
YQVHADHLGTPRLITDSANKAVWQWPYSAFGSNKPTGILNTIGTGAQARVKATAPTLEVNLRFPGQYYDVESNLSLNGFRSYRWSDGRYTQPDPIGLIAGLNRIIYANANTLAYTDPLGLANSAATFWMRGKKLSTLPDAPLACQRPPECTAIYDWCACSNATTEICIKLTTCSFSKDPRPAAPLQCNVQPPRMEVILPPVNASREKW